MKNQSKAKQSTTPSQEKQSLNGIPPPQPTECSYWAVTLGEDMALNICRVFGTSARIPRCPVFETLGVGKPSFT